MVVVIVYMLICFHVSFCCITFANRETMLVRFNANITMDVGNLSKINQTRNTVQRRKERRGKNKVEEAICKYIKS
jgi:hypothetical protein